MRDHVFPGAVMAARVRREGLYVRAAGSLTYDDTSAPVTRQTVYDLASLTKVLVTTAAAMILTEEGRLDVDARLADLLPEIAGGAAGGVTIAQLLSHSSGLPAWAPLYLDTAGRDGYVRRIGAMALERAPGTATVYSDLGFILLGVALERVSGETLDELAARRIFAPLGMSEATRFRPDPATRAHIAPTENDPWRGRLLQGEVHDENAFALGGVAGHAGLFGPVDDVVRFAQAMMEGGAPLVRRETLERFAAPCGVPGSSYGLGWDHPSGEGSSAGQRFPRTSIGHLGFTGTSLWIDRDAGTFLILLANSVHPKRGNAGLRDVRAALADAVVDGAGPLDSRP